MLTLAEKVKLIDDIVCDFDGFLSVHTLVNVTKLPTADVEKILEDLLKEGKLSTRQFHEVREWSKHSIDKQIHRLHGHNLKANSIAEILKVPENAVRFVLSMSLDKYLASPLRQCHATSAERAANLVYAFVCEQVGKATKCQGPDYDFLSRTPEKVKDELHFLLVLVSKGVTLCDSRLYIPATIKDDARLLVQLLYNYNLLPLETNRDLRDFLKTKFRK